jgi:Clostripain family
MKLAIIKLVLLLSLLSHNLSGKTYDWLLVYYMPYDNNLSPFAKNIIQHFFKSTISDNVCATLQVDLSGQGGMTRYSFYSKVDSLHLNDEGSASTRALDEYLLWVSKKFKAKHYAIILLNHGGGLNEYGLDENGSSNEWMHIDGLANSIEKFTKLVKIPKIDLLFEQVCARGTIENLYEFRKIAKYTLASQDLVPAPGYYYSKMFSGLGTGKINSGDKLAEVIVNSERDDMYYSYTLIDNSKWDDWLQLLERYSVRLAHSNSKIRQEALKIVFYEGDSYFDFISLINATSLTNDILPLASEIKTFTNDVLIIRLYLNNKYERMSDYSGLSVCSPFRSTSCPLTIYSLNGYQAFLASLRNLSKIKM